MRARECECDGKQVKGALSRASQVESSNKIMVTFITTLTKPQNGLRYQKIFFPYRYVYMKVCAPLYDAQGFLFSYPFSLCIFNSIHIGTILIFLCLLHLLVVIKFS